MFYLDPYLYWKGGKKTFLKTQFWTFPKITAYIVDKTIVGMKVFCIN